MTHYTTVTSTFTGNSGPFTAVDSSVLKLADSLEMTVRIADGLDTSGIDMAGAIRRYRQFAVVEDRAQAHPGRDWAAQIRRFVLDPLAGQLIDELAETSRKQLRTVGHARFDDEVTSASARTITITGCIDTIGASMKNDGDLPIYPAAGSYVPHRTVMTRGSDGRWYISSMQAHHQQHCTGYPK